MRFYTDKKVDIVMKKYKEKYKTGMIFRSKKYPWADIIIDYVSYNRMAENSYVCRRKGYDYDPEEDGRMDFKDKTTFPYPSWGEMKPKSMDAYIKKYELEYVGTSDREIIIYQDNEDEYSSGFKNKYD